MDADFPRIHPRESALIGGFIPFSITHASHGKLDRFVNFVGTKWTYIVSQKGRVRIMIFGMTTFTIVLIVQLFLKVPALKAIAPTQSELPFVLAQIVVLSLFVAVAIAAAIRFRNLPLRTA